MRLNKWLILVFKEIILRTNQPTQEHSVNELQSGMNLYYETFELPGMRVSIFGCLYLNIT
jgi:hypothetical protein